MKVLISKSREETQGIGEEIAPKIKNGGIVALYGELGSGKTTFVQGLARSLGIKKRIISPTFVIVRTYKVKTPSFAKASKGKQKSKVLYHIDLYRVDGGDKIEGLGMKEILDNPQNIIVIEWAEKLRNLLPRKRIDIHFEYLSKNQRKIEIIN